MAVSSQVVLIVEDDASMRGAIERLLRTAGFSVLAYESAEALLAVDVPTKTACVVSDLKLPGMSGLDLFAELRVRGCEAPLILITAYDAPGRCAEALRSGAEAYLVKPFHGTALLDAIRAVAERQETS